MKKTISILLVVLLASACLFADVSLTGELGFGYKVKFDGTVENQDYLNLGSTYGGRFKIKLGSDYVNGEYVVIEYKGGSYIVFTTSKPIEVISVEHDVDVVY